MSMNVSGCVSIFVDACECLNVCGFAWMCVNVCECVGMCVNACGFVRKFCESLRISTTVCTCV